VAAWGVEIPQERQMLFRVGSQLGSSVRFERKRLSHVSRKGMPNVIEMYTCSSIASSTGPLTSMTAPSGLSLIAMAPYAFASNSNRVHGSRPAGAWSLTCGPCVGVKGKPRYTTPKCVSVCSSVAFWSPSHLRFACALGTAFQYEISIGGALIEY